MNLHTLMEQPRIEISKNILMPMLGLGTWKLHGAELETAIRTAIDVGYRHLDCAFIYQNQKQIGELLPLIDVMRSDLFITSKVWRTSLDHYDVVDECEYTLRELKTDYLDLYLIHWPNKNVPIEETLEALQGLKDTGKIRAIGVSNFTEQHLEDALAVGVEISVNQVEYHPTWNQKGLKAYCDGHGITLTAYSPIGQGKDLKLPLIAELAERYGRSASQVILNWLLQKGIAAIPRSGNPAHIEDNFKTLAWSLTSEDVGRIDAIPLEERVVAPSYAEFD